MSIMRPVWSCAKGSFALDVQFKSWSGSVTAPYDATTGYLGTPCSNAQATISVGPVARAAASP
jgi:hypothetical protein